MFEPEAAYDEDASIMKNDEEASADNETVMSVIDGDKPDHDDDTHPDDEPPQPPRGGQAALRVVKSYKTGPGGLFCLFNDLIK